MELNISEYTSNLTYLETIKLRNHIGNGYLVAENINDCDESEEYTLEKRKITDMMGEKPFTGLVPIITIDVDSREKAHLLYENTEVYSKKNCITIYDVWYDSSDKEMIITLEPFELE